MTDRLKAEDQASTVEQRTNDSGFGEINCGPCCSLNYLTPSGKRLLLARILLLAFIPLICVFGFTTSSLYDSIIVRSEIQGALDSMEVVRRMGRLIHKFQQERDMTVFYISKLGPATKTFLLKYYEETGDVFKEMKIWPPDFQQHPRKEFHSRIKLENYISQHRKYLDPDNSSTIEEIQFYTAIADQFMTWMVENIREAGFGNFWKSLLAYQKLIRCNLDAGAERAYGTMFYGNGKFRNWEELETYNKRIHSFQFFYKAAALYSPLVDPLLEESQNEINTTVAINAFRTEMRNSEINSSVPVKSLNKAQWFFDNMTKRIDTLLDLQESIAAKIMLRFDTTLFNNLMDMIVYAIVLIVFAGICPIIVNFLRFLTTDIVKYSTILFEKSSELKEEKRRAETIVYQLIPKSIADRLKNNSKIESEFFKSVTIMFSSIVEFTKLTIEYSPIELIGMLNYLYKYLDEKIDYYDVYKVETINDTYMLVSGLPVPNDERHASEIAYFGLEILRIVRHSGFSQSLDGHQLQLLIGISTGSVSAGIVGTNMFRYCLFGDTVNIASRMMSCGLPNKIQLSESSYRNLKKTGHFKLKSRGTIEVKGKGHMNTYWLHDTVKDVAIGKLCTLPGPSEQLRERVSLCSVSDATAENSSGADIKVYSSRTERQMSTVTKFVTPGAGVLF